MTQHAHGEADEGGTETHPRVRDYVAWHEAYRDADSALSVRLRHVQQTISDWYDAVDGPCGSSAPAPVRATTSSACWRRAPS